jgi:hypothetical protein
VLRRVDDDAPLARAAAARQRHRKTVTGRGHLERRGEDAWRLVVYRGRDASGRRYERRPFGGTEDEAQVGLARLIIEVAEGGLELDPRKLTFGEVLDLWYQHVLPDLESTTAERIGMSLATFPSSCGGCRCGV